MAGSELTAEELEKINRYSQQACEEVLARLKGLTVDGTDIACDLHLYDPTGTVNLGYVGKSFGGGTEWRASPVKLTGRKTSYADHYRTFIKAHEKDRIQ